MPRTAFDDGPATPDELLRVLALNRNAILIMDSDRHEPGAVIDSHKNKAAEACESNGGKVWITDGRAIENYLPPGVVINGCKQLCDEPIEFKCGKFQDFGTQLESALRAGGKKNFQFKPQKVNCARLFAQHFEAGDFEPELEDQIRRVVNAIRTWNPDLP